MQSVESKAYTLTAEKLGIQKEHFEKHIQTLEQAFRNVYDLYLKTLFYHWNYKGSSFMSIHQFLDDQYTQLATYLDDLAERLRMLGVQAPVPSMIGEAHIHHDNTVPDHNSALENLRNDHYTVASFLRRAIESAEAVNDKVTADMLTGQLSEHEKAAWFCNASLEQ